MRAHSPWLRLGGYVVAVGLGAGVGASCTVDYPTVAFRCNPRQSNSCPETHFCCSDDPAAEGGALPRYTDKNLEGGGAPYFSGINNALGSSGMCVRREDIPAGSGLVEPATFGCPIPCNPTWSDADIDSVCGIARECCQTVPLQPEDCVLVDGQWRAVSGQDIGAPSEGGVPITDWRPGSHATHQDPAGQGCQGLAGGMAEGAVFEDCVEQLTVADQRGYCLVLSPGQLCPTQQPTFVDACAQLNAP